jgi:UDP-N-acetylmuramyl pentapeptide phosphotransferase/UDP-N-acetylglucosamine-1-phosphate transferase
MQTVDALRLALAFALALVVSGGGIVLLKPVWRNYALARPNARSSHKVPTSQGGGIAVVLGACCAILFAPASLQLYGVFAAALGLAAVGALDDLTSLPAPPRLAAQAAVAIAVASLLPADFHALPVLPWWAERALLAVGLLWFINLTNFMDGIDWISVIEFVPLTAALALFALAGVVKNDVAIVAAALCGALIGFAPFNRPVARLFLGDVGSLPLGLVSGWLLIRLAEHHLAAALLLPLYYLADATVTLLRRAACGEPLMQAHRRHFYQQAVDGRMTVTGVVARIFALNCVLIALAAFCIAMPGLLMHTLAFGLGCAAVATLLVQFARAKG